MCKYKFATEPSVTKDTIAAFKQQTAQPESDKRRFEYDPDQPLHLVEQKTEKA
jgi:hypothetical protein